MKRILAISAYGISILLILLALVGDFIFFFPFRVANNWVAHVPNTLYHPGEHLTYHSSFIKTIGSPGMASRYVVCNNTSYLVSQSVSKRDPGKRSGEVTIIIPSNIVVPATCHIHVDVRWQLFGLRTLIESVDSNNFRLE